MSHEFPEMIVTFKFQDFAIDIGFGKKVSELLHELAGNEANLSNHSISVEEYALDERQMTFKTHTTILVNRIIPIINTYLATFESREQVWLQKENNFWIEYKFTSAKVDSRGSDWETFCSYVKG
jgi:hypothetical protein